MKNKQLITALISILIIATATPFAGGQTRVIAYLTQYGDKHILAGCWLCCMRPIGSG